MFDLSAAAALVVVGGLFPLLRLWSAKVLATSQSATLSHDFARVTKAITG